MADSRFTLTFVQTQFPRAIADPPDCLAAISPVPFSDWLRQILVADVPLATAIAPLGGVTMPRSAAIAIDRVSDGENFVPKRYFDLRKIAFYFYFLVLATIIKQVISRDRSLAV